MSDLTRRILVTVSLIVCYIGTAFGTGLVGDRVAESAGGALSDTATLIAPDGPAFSIWSVIYVGLLLYTIWQWLPSVASDSRARATGGLAAASMLLNGAWLGVTQVGWIWVSVLVIVALLAVLARLMVVIHREQPRGWFELLAVDVTFGLYLGWVAVAVCANVTAAFVDAGVDLGAAADWAGVALLVVVAAVGVFLAFRLGGRFAITAALAWGLAWIAVARLAGDPLSTPVGVAAAVAAVVVVVATLVARMRTRRPLVG
ncbi:hypothetical protein [Propioniciclava soli]|uniref:hypothetical protein n=1 Tax=Propioniciclava soli TaxID=2775081 RepID=UPI001E362D4D|nr:hypothetical protein [Propioniciclava soli]